jgi:hypothetical protein
VDADANPPPFAKSLALGAKRAVIREVLRAAKRLMGQAAGGLRGFSARGPGFGLPKGACRGKNSPPRPAEGAPPEKVQEVYQERGGKGKKKIYPPRPLGAGDAGAGAGPERAAAPKLRGGAGRARARKSA